MRRGVKFGLGCVTATVLALTLAGCNPGASWTKAGGTEQQMTADTYACEAAGRNAGNYDDGTAAESRMKSTFQTCMASKGYTKGQ
jgi:hypothetical protein